MENDRLTVDEFSSPSNETTYEPMKFERDGGGGPVANALLQTSNSLVSITGLLMSKAKASSFVDRESSIVAGGVRTAKVEENYVGGTPFRSPLVRVVTKFEETDSNLLRRSSFSGGSSGTTTLLNNNRRGTVFGGMDGGKKHDPGNINESDLRKYVFQHGRGKRLMSGLRVHAFTRQAFVSSFTVGLAIGSIVAILLKVLKDVTTRLLFS